MKKIKNFLEQNKKISVSKTYQNAEKNAKDWLRKIKIYKIEKFNSVFSTDEGSVDK